MHEAFARTYALSISPAIKSTYLALKPKQPVKNPVPFIGMNSTASFSELLFDAKFEGGNLDKVVKVQEQMYELYMRPDANTRGHYQWFYFSVRNPGAAVKATFHIVNFSKKDSQYTQGLTPCIRSSLKPKLAWHRLPDHVQYTPSKLGRARIYYTLTFSYTFEPNEQVYFAQSLPYTYSDLIKFIKPLGMEEGTLCKTLSGVDVPLLTIGNANPGSRLVLVTARVHPGETHSSYVMEGFLRFLVSDSPVAAELKRHCLFKVVPMLNPDGVIVGNSRCNLAGDDLNRQFTRPSPRLHPTVDSLKKLLSSLKSKYSLTAFLDFHSHYQKKGSFLYGPQFPLHSSKYCRTRIIPKLLSEQSEVFRYHSCRFRYDWSKRNTARIRIAREFRLPYCYTIECSCHGYLNLERETIPFTNKSLHQLGQDIAKSLHEYIELSEEERKAQELRKAERLERLKKRKSKDKKPVSPQPKEVLKPKRTIADVIHEIKQVEVDAVPDSESSDSESDMDTSEETYKIQTNILNLLDQVTMLSAATKVHSQKTMNTKRKHEFGLKSVEDKRGISAPRQKRKELRCNSSSGKPRLPPSKYLMAMREKRTECVKTKVFHPLAEEAEARMGQQYQFRSNKFRSNKFPKFASEQKIAPNTLSDSDFNARQEAIQFSVKGRQVKPLDLEKKLSDSFEQ